MIRENIAPIFLMAATILCLAGPSLADDAEASRTAVTALLKNAYDSYTSGQYEQAAAQLERALRIESRNPILWHNLAGVRLKQEQWARARSLAIKSLSLTQRQEKVLRIRSMVLIKLACEGLKNMECVDDVQKQIVLWRGQR